MATFTNENKSNSGGVTLQEGSPIGLLLSLTYAATQSISGISWTNVAKNVASFTNTSKSTSAWTNLTKN